MTTISDVTRISIEWPTVKHRELKARVAQEGIYMKQFILDAIEEKLNHQSRDEKVDTK